MRHGYEVPGPHGGMDEIGGVLKEEDGEGEDG